MKEEMLFEALTTRKTVTVGEKLIVPYKLSEVTLRLQRQSRASVEKEQTESRQLLVLYSVFAGLQSSFWKI